MTPSTGYGGVHHPLERPDLCGMLLTFFLPPTIAIKVLSPLLTLIGMALALTGNLSEEKYGLLSHPINIFLVGTGAFLGTCLYHLAIQWLVQFFIRRKKV